jgi:hypothetical protein
LQGSGEIALQEVVGWTKGTGSFIIDVYLKVLTMLSCLQVSKLSSTTEPFHGQEKELHQHRACGG